VESVRLWYMNLAATDVQIVSVVCWSFVALAMGALALLLSGER
jgi:hypothetical protein